VLISENQTICKKVQLEFITVVGSDALSSWTKAQSSNMSAADPSFL